MKSNIDFVRFCETAYQRGDWYILGGFGNVLTASFIESKARQYIYNANNKTILTSKIGKIAHDCYGLLKAFVWDNENGEGHYNINGCADRNEASAYTQAVSKGKLDTIPREKGIAVYKNGHVGFVVDCSAPSYQDWIVIEVYSIPVGMYRRTLKEGGWTDWFKDTYLEYRATPIETEGAMTHTIARGDTLWGLARTYVTTVAEIQRLNPGIDANNLHVGQVVVIREDGNTALQVEVVRLRSELVAAQQQIATAKQERDRARAAASAAISTLEAGIK